MTSNDQLKKVLILALGGEGGGTLAEWVVAAGTASGFPIQATSVPGVAQRTGGTSYYIECLPRVLHLGSGGDDAEQRPPMCLAPLAADLDLIISSELLETARAIERGFSDPKRTHVITSTARALTVEERISTTDGRADSARLLRMIQEHSQRFDSADLTMLAKSQGTVVSAVMFGALCSSGVLSFTREVCEQVIRDSDTPTRAKASLAGFDRGFASLVGGEKKGGQHPQSSDDANADLDSRGLHYQQVRALGEKKLLDYQDTAYAEEYSRRLDQCQALDAAPFVVSREVARSLARWMAYEDIIRVADLKSQRSRFDAIRRDYQAKEGEPIVVHDYLKPGVEEIAAILPPRWATRLLAWAKARNVVTFGNGMTLKTSDVSGLLVMRLLAKLRFMRRRSSRFHHEQVSIATWWDCLIKVMQSNDKDRAALALEIARLPSLIRGYSDTFARGRREYEAVMALIDAQVNTKSALDLAQLLRGLRSKGTPVAQQQLAGLVEQPLKFMRPEKLR